MATILLIDDDQKLTEPMRFRLEGLGYRVLVAADGRTGLGMALTEKPDIVVLDIMLPGMKGWDVCQEIRRFSQVPVLMLTALDGEVDRVRGLDLGADDYLTKPFSAHELVAHIRAMLRRIQWDHQANPEIEYQVGELRVEIPARRAFKKDVELAMRPKEYDLLLVLMRQAGKVVERESLFHQVWETDWLGDMRTLDVHIRWLRQKIEDDPSNPRYIQTVRGVGYRFATTEEMSEEIR